MCKVIRHRGPDDEGYYTCSKIGLCNRRLSIIDVKGGHQPIHNEDGTIWITYNGEIYNYKELSRELEKRHNFYTNSDTEVIVHCYEEYGEEFVNKLNGMFAFAIWDSNKEELLIYRDRFGIKPLYYYYNGEKLFFGSEIKAILQSEEVERTPNDKVIYEFLVHGWHDHTEETFFKGVKRLMPAHYLKVNSKGLKIRKYWEIKKLNQKIESKEEKDKELTEKFYNLFLDSVKKRLISEVPVGTCLSGGMDSSSIVCIINKLLRKGISKEVIGEKQKTFSAVYKEKEADETPYIEEVIKFTNSEKNFTHPNAEELWKELDKIIWYQEEPFGSTSIYAQWCVMKEASKKVKVVLDGQGGDELLAGYTHYYIYFLKDLLKQKRIIQFIKNFFLGLDLFYKDILHHLLNKRKEKKLIQEMLNKEFIKKYKGEVKTPWKIKNLTTYLLNSLTQISIPHLLRYEDKNAMAHSIESRVPFLDHRLVEYVFNTPENQKIRNGWTKYILRKAMKGEIPEKVRKRRSKLGFATPEVKWLRELSKEIIETFETETFKQRKYFNQEKVTKNFEEFVKGKFTLQHSIFWRVVILEKWLNLFIDEKK